jgi:hypothetical protein
LEISTRALAASAICIALAVSLLVLSGPSLELTTFSEVPFENIEQGVWGHGPVSRIGLAIRDESEWENLWSEIHAGSIPMLELPFVDFTTEMIIVAAQGERSTGGFLTNITRITVTGGFYMVFVDEIHPGPDCGVPMAISHPYHIVKIGGFPPALPVQFIYNVTLFDCS